MLMEQLDIRYKANIPYSNVFSILILFCCYMQAKIGHGNMPSFTSCRAVLVTLLLAILLLRPNLLLTATKLNSYAFLSFVVLVLAVTELTFFIVASMGYEFFILLCWKHC